MSRQIIKSAATLFLTAAILFSSTLSAQDLTEVGWLQYGGSMSDLYIRQDVAFIAGSYGLFSVDVSDPGNPTLIDYQPNYNWKGASISASSDLLCINPYDWFGPENGEQSFYDISDPGSLERLPDFLDLPQIISCAIDDNYIYARSTERNASLLCFDISDRDNPEVLDTLMRVYGEKLILNDNLRENDLLIAWSTHNSEQIDFIGIEHPSRLALYDEYRFQGGSLSFSPEQAFAAQDFLFMVHPDYDYESNVMSSRIECIDYSDRRNVVQRCEIELEGYIQIIGSHNNYIFIRQDVNGEDPIISMFSFENPDSLERYADIEFQIIPDKMVVQDDRLYCLNSNSLTIYDTHWPDPELLGEFRTNTCLNPVIKLDDHIVFRTEDDSLRMISITNPERPRETNAYKPDPPRWLNCTWQSEAGDEYILASAGSSRVEVLQFNSGRLETVSEFSLDPEPENPDEFGFTIVPWSDGVVVIGGDENRELDYSLGYVWVIDLENIREPEIIGYLDEQRGTYFYSVFLRGEILVHDDYIYIPGYSLESGCYIISLQDPSDPEIVYYNRDDRFTEPLCADENLLFAGSYIYNLEDPASPERIGILPRISGSLVETAIEGDILTAIYNKSPHLQRIDVSNPEEPAFITGMDISDRPHGLFTEGNWIYLLKTSGLQILYHGEYGIEQDKPMLQPGAISLYIHPNPFNSSVSISYNLSINAPVLLSIYDIHGRRLETLLDKTILPGSHTVAWDASGLPSGEYLVRLSTPLGSDVRKAVLVR